MCEMEALNQRHADVTALLDQVLEISTKQDGLCFSGTEMEKEHWTQIVYQLKDLLASVMCRQIVETGTDLSSGQVYDTAQDLTGKILQEKMKVILDDHGITPVAPGIFAIDLGKVNFVNIFNIFDE